METTRKIRIDAEVKYPDDKRPLTLALANLWREYSEWLESVGPSLVMAEGEIELKSGFIKWRRLP